MGVLLDVASKVIQGETAFLIPEAILSSAYQANATRSGTGNKWSHALSHHSFTTRRGRSSDFAASSSSFCTNPKRSPQKKHPPILRELASAQRVVFSKPRNKRGFGASPLTPSGSTPVLGSFSSYGSDHALNAQNINFTASQVECNPTKILWTVVIDLRHRHRHG